VAGSFGGKERAMISSPQIIPMLVDASPSFKCAEDLLYVALGDFARHLLELYQRKETVSFSAVCAVIERLYVEGDHGVQEAATIGLLEGIQNVWGNNNVDPELFASYLLPESRKWWDELNAFWRGERDYVGAGLHSQSL
jgi:hypothetical protein